MEIFQLWGYWRVQLINEICASPVFMVTSLQLSAEPSYLIVENGVKCFLTFQAFIDHLIALSGIYPRQLQLFPMFSTVQHYAQVSDVSALHHHHHHHSFNVSVPLKVGRAAPMFVLSFFLHSILFAGSALDSFQCLRSLLIVFSMSS